MIRSRLPWNQLQVKLLYTEDDVYFVSLELSVTEDMKSE